MINPTLTPFLLLFALVVSAQGVAAEEWRGLVPLRSTQADVVRLFGECANQYQSCEFEIENENILIAFSSPSGCDNVPAGTVLSIQRELQIATTFDALHFDRRRFKSFDPSIPRDKGYRGFVDEKSGLLLKTFEGEVFQINYIAPKKDWPVCDVYYRSPREFIQVVMPHVMMIHSVGCPGSSRVAGEKVVIVANYPRTGERLLVSWEVSHGKIIKGQNTNRILLDTTGLQGKEVIVTFEVSSGYHHTASASCSFSVVPGANK